MNRLRFYWKNATRAPFMAALAVIAVLAPARTIIDPDSQPLYAAIGNWVYLWSVVYGVGGALLLFGAATWKGRYEAAGATLFAYGALVQAVVTLTAIGTLGPFISIWTAVNLGFFALAGFLRASHLKKGQRLIWLERGETSYGS